MSASIGKTSIRQVLYEAMQQVCCQSTPCKVGSIALGVLLIGVATFMYCSQINAIATYTTFGFSGAAILIAAFTILVEYTGATKIPTRGIVLHDSAKR